MNGGCPTVHNGMVVIVVMVMVLPPAIGASTTGVIVRQRQRLEAQSIVAHAVVATARHAQDPIDATCAMC